MKSRLRNLTIEGQAYVYWYTSGHRFTLNLSPKDNKNIKITLIFQADPPDEDPYTFWAFYDITAVKDGLQTTIHLGKPKHIAQILSYLRKERSIWFTPGQGRPHVVEHAWDLLQEMGYSRLEPVWVGEW